MPNRKKLTLTREVLRTLSGSELDAAGAEAHAVPAPLRKTIALEECAKALEPRPTGFPRRSEYYSCGIVCFPQPCGEE